MAWSTVVFSAFQSSNPHFRNHLLFWSLRLHSKKRNKQAEPIATMILGLLFGVERKSPNCIRTILFHYCHHFFPFLSFPYLFSSSVSPSIWLSERSSCFLSVTHISLPLFSKYAQASKLLASENKKKRRKKGFYSVLRQYEFHATSRFLFFPRRMDQKIKDKGMHKYACMVLYSFTLLSIILYPLLFHSIWKLTRLALAASNFAPNSPRLCLQGASNIYTRISKSSRPRRTLPLKLPGLQPP